MSAKNFRSRLGLLRSRIMYYWKPFNRRRLRKFYTPFVPTNGLCFDIGAHLGNRIGPFVDLGARVIAVEPQPLCLEYLKKQYGDHDQVQILPVAIGAAPGKATLHISQMAPTVSTLAGQAWREGLQQRSNIEVDWEEQIEVKLLTLDQLIETYGLPDFCKIDVEDYEAEVLKGLSQPIPQLSFEFFSWTPKRTQECLDLLDQLGDYRYNWSIGESQQMADVHWLSSTALQKQLQTLDQSLSGDIYAQLQD